MLGLWLFGVQVERAIGRVRYLGIYLLAALGGSVCSFWLTNPRVLGVGASGAVFGLFGAYFVLARAARPDTSGVGGLIIVNLVLGLANPILDNWAHLGGLVTGGALAAALAATRGLRGPGRI